MPKIRRIAPSTLAAMLMLGVVAPGANGLGAGGVKGTLGTNHAVISADGSHLAFQGRGSNLHPDAAGMHVYVRNLDTGVTEVADRATGAAGPVGADGYGFQPSISADGRFVAFTSQATNLHPSDVSGDFDVFVRDMQTGTTHLASREPGGASANQDAEEPSISADGRFVAFSSKATNLPGTSELASDVYVHDLQTKTIQLVSRATGVAGEAGDLSSWYPSISADGSRVAFHSSATNLDPDSTDGPFDVFVRDLQAQTTTLVSRASGAAGPEDNGGAMRAVISGDGSTVAFESYATNLDPADLSSDSSVFVRDLETDTTTLASRADGVAGAKANNWATYAAISHDGTVRGLQLTGYESHPGRHERELRRVHARHSSRYDDARQPRNRGGGCERKRHLVPRRTVDVRGRALRALLLLCDESEPGRPRPGGQRRLRAGQTGPHHLAGRPRDAGLHALRAPEGGVAAACIAGAGLFGVRGAQSCAWPAARVRLLHTGGPGLAKSDRRCRRRHRDARPVGGLGADEGPGRQPPAGGGRHGRTPHDERSPT